MNALTSTELHGEVLIQMGEEDTREGRESVRQVLTALAEVAANELHEGLPFTIPGICRIAPMYVAAKPKREVRNFDGELVMANPQPAKVRVKARPTNTLRAAAPSPRSLAGKRLAKEAAKRTRGAARRSGMRVAR